jgi:subtilisin family serine protease
MFYAILPIAIALLSAPLVSFTALDMNVIVSFSEGNYDPELISELGGKVLGESKHLRMIHATIPVSKYSELAAIPSVEFVERDSQALFVTSDSVESAEYSESWGIEAIGAEVAHSHQFTGNGIKIAILDTGIDYTHPDLSPNYNGGYDFINDDDDPMDDNGHGTHVAGIIAAARDGQGVLGVAPEAEIYAVKVSDERGKGSFSGLIKGIDWAIEHDADIVTMSITGTGGTMALQRAVQDAYDEYGIILVAAVGNGGSGEVLYPAAYDEVIGVGSVNEDNLKSSFSRVGEEVELVAPGSDIKSAAVGGKYRTTSGTSMATPFVAGAAALLLESDERLWEDIGGVNGDGEWTNDEVRQVLRETATDLGEEGADDAFGYGLLNLEFPDMTDSQIVSVNAGENIDNSLNTASLWRQFLLSLG